MYSYCITRMTEIRNLRRTGRITSMREMRNAYKSYVGNLKEGIDGKLLLIYT